MHTYDQAEEPLIRKRLLYKSKVEYMSGEGVYCMNHAQGCLHGCAYPCYAYMLAKRYGKVDGPEQWRRVRLVENWEELLKREIAGPRKEPIRRVHLCFTTDPFPYVEPYKAQLRRCKAGDAAWTEDWAAPLEAGMDMRLATLGAMRILNTVGIPVTLLTKGTYPKNLAVESLGADSWLHPENEYGASVSSLSEEFRAKWEPGAALYAERIAGLRDLHRVGCRTWVSIEPYPALATGEDGYDDLRRILRTVDFADKIVFGRWNYSQDAPCNVDDPAAFWDGAAKVVREFCSDRGIDCVIKRGTEAA